MRAFFARQAENAGDVTKTNEQTVIYAYYIVFYMHFMFFGADRPYLFSYTLFRYGPPAHIAPYYTII
jgi:hypothetical protein